MCQVAVGSDGAAVAERPMPCLGGVCVGADLATLLDLEWHHVEPPRPAQGLRGLGRLARALRGDADAVEVARRHWPHHWFGPTGLRALAALEAVCDDLGVSWRPQAALSGPDGEPVVVTFEPVPSQAGASAFRVATVSMRLPADPERQAGARRELAPGYAGHPIYPTRERAGVRWLTDREGRASLKLFAPIRDTVQQISELASQPACSAAVDEER